jgi:hypothetical protein
MDEIYKEIHIEFREAVKWGVGFQGSAHGKGYISEAAVVIVRDDGATEYYPWNNILAVRAREIRHAEEAVIVEERIEDMIHQMMVA